MGKQNGKTTVTQHILIGEPTQWAHVPIPSPIWQPKWGVFTHCVQRACIQPLHLGQYFCSLCWGTQHESPREHWPLGSDVMKMSKEVVANKKN